MHDQRWAAFGVTVLLYALAFAPLALLQQNKDANALAAIGSGLVGFIFGAVLLALVQTPLARAGAYGLAIGLVLAELAWAVSYWPASGLIGGAFLWLVFYVLAGLSQAHVEQALDRRVAVEYAVVSVLGMAIILSAAPWRI